MSQNKTTLIQRVLQDLNVVGLGQAPDDEDTDLVDSRITTLVAELIARQVCYLPNLDDIDDAVFEPLIEYLVAKLGPGYGRPAVPQLVTEMIEDRIKEVSRPVAARRTLSTDSILRQGNRRPGGFNFTTGQ